VPCAGDAPLNDATVFVPMAVLGSRFGGGATAGALTTSLMGTRTGVGILVGLAICTLIYVIVGAVLTGMVKYTDLGVADPLAKALDVAGYKTVGWIVALGANLLHEGERVHIADERVVAR